MKWCVTLGENGWGYFIHPYRGEQDDNEFTTDTFNSFQEAKRECLSRYSNFLNEVKEEIKLVRKTTKILILKKAEGKHLNRI